jgi:hypothetical protein
MTYHNLIMYFGHFPSVNMDLVQFAVHAKVRLIIVIIGSPVACSQHNLLSRYEWKVLANHFERKWVSTTCPSEYQFLSSIASLFLSSIKLLFLSRGVQTDHWNFKSKDDSGYDFFR